MEKLYILHLFTPMAQASPFDINMAYDAGYDGVVPYAHVELEQVAALTQDTIFRVDQGGSAQEFSSWPKQWLPPDISMPPGRRGGRRSRYRCSLSEGRSHRGAWWADLEH